MTTRLHTLATFTLTLALPAQNPLSTKPTVLGTPVRMHQNVVTEVAFSADGTLALSVSMNGDLFVWDAKTGKRTGTLDCKGQIEDAAFCGPKNERIAIVDKNAGLRLLDARTGKPFATVPGLTGLAVAADRVTLASTTKKGELLLLDAMTAKPKATIAVGKSLYSPCFSPDGNTVLVDEFMAGKTYVVDVLQSKVTGEVALARFKSDRTFVPDGKSVISMSGQKVRRVAIPSGEQQGIWELPEAGTSLAIRNDGNEVVVGDMNGTMLHIDLAAGATKHTWQEHRGLVGRLAVSPDGKTLLSGSWDATVRFWDFDSGKELFPSPAHNNMVMSVAFAPDGKTLASGAWDNTAMLWGIDGKPKSKVTAHEYLVSAVAVQADGTWWSASQDRTLRHWRATGEEVGKIAIEGEGAAPTCLALVAKDTSLITGHADGSVRWFDAVSGEQKRSATGHEGSITAIAVDAAGAFVASASADGNVIVWNVEKGEPQHTLAVHKDGVASLTLLGDGVLVSCGGKGELVRIDGKAGKETHRIVFGGTEPRSLTSLAAVPGRGLFFAVNGRQLCSFAAADLRVMGEGAAPSDVFTLTAAADGSAAAAGLDDGTIAVWKLIAAPAKPGK